MSNIFQQLCDRFNEIELPDTKDVKRFIVSKSFQRGETILIKTEKKVLLISKKALCSELLNLL